MLHCLLEAPGKVRPSGKPFIEAHWFINSATELDVSTAALTKLDIGTPHCVA
jgi:hypothetical protein